MHEFRPPKSSQAAAPSSIEILRPIGYLTNATKKVTCFFLGAFLKISCISTTILLIGATSIFDGDFKAHVPHHDTPAPKPDPTTTAP